ncbi:polyhydroxybutyrate depolymerase [Roseovarius azorensis]|uniref:Polyhydroxybutyrate depolymerase n=1 Tax=Roseovarius azorensis TaxID=1287727 RepID=A0A1H7T1P4_9RHOB|nr:prolyl oligopeptidase family serine peptidase [Roseovarius azorensis]SEL78840.1 polyhydroxybutyrate depolymerase [Roseovarius azorensis]
MRFLIVLSTLLTFSDPVASFACGPDTDCRLGDRHYRIALPEGQGADPVGAVVFAHGYRGTAESVMRNKALRRMVSDMGLALIALKSADDDWVIPYAPRHMDSDGSVEFRYVEAVLEDAARRFPIDGARLMAAGFSAGGMMVWNLACAMPERFAGFAAIAGTFWMKPPTQCAEPAASLVHIHGTSDPTVPLKGRAILETRQGDVAEALDMYGTLGDFRPSGETSFEDLTCQTRRNASGEILDFCLHPGGHSFRSSYLKFAWERLRAAGQL